MAKRKGGVKTITVVVPRHGTPATSRALVKTVTVEAAKTNRAFQAQDPVSQSDLQGLEDASNWNGLLLNARGERGPQWDVTSQMHHVQIGSEEYFNPTLLQDEPIPVPEDESKAKKDMETEAQTSLPPSSATQQDVTMASPTHVYQQGMPGGGMSMSMARGVPMANRYPQYGQPMNGAVPHGVAPIPDHMGVNPMYGAHPQQHAMHPGGNPMPPQAMYGQPNPSMDSLRHHQQPSPTRGVSMGGLSYNNIAGAPAGHAPPMSAPAMSMGGYGGMPQGSYPPGMQGGMPGNVPQYPRPGGHNPAPMSGSYGGMY